MYRYTLQPYHGRDSRFHCPACNNSRRTFKRYIDTVTRQYLADHVGKCDRIDTCGYHFTPRDYFAATPGILRQAQYNNLWSTRNESPVKPFDTLPRSLVDDTAREYHRNNFICFLGRCFGHNNALQLAQLYKVGTSKYWPGACIFWQIDVNDRVRTGKIKLYNDTDGHRVKVPFNHIAWAHRLSLKSNAPGPETDTDSTNKTHDYRLQQCFFGEHLLQTDPFKTVAIVESEKTAIICSFIDPRFIWLAAGSLEGLNTGKCKVLKDRSVILYPDVNGCHKWRRVARELRLRFAGINISVDDTLERIATDDERARGIDIADIWIDQLTLKP